MRRVFSAKATILVPLESVRIVFLILHGGIISLLADRTGHRDNVTHPLPFHSVVIEPLLPPPLRHDLCHHARADRLAPLPPRAPHPPLPPHSPSPTHPPR